MHSYRIGVDYKRAAAEFNKTIFRLQEADDKSKNHPDAKPDNGKQKSFVNKNPPYEGIRSAQYPQYSGIFLFFNYNHGYRANKIETGNE